MAVLIIGVVLIALLVTVVAWRYRRRSLMVVTIASGHCFMPGDRVALNFGDDRSEAKVLSIEGAKVTARPIRFRLPRPKA